MFRSVARVPVRALGVKRDRDGDKTSPGVGIFEQPDGKGSFKLNLSPEACCGLEDAGDVELQIHRRVQDGQPVAGATVL